ncbi:MAG TPA: hypothetical protein VKV26_18590 [Dehalococcoidia bacterium]|nr:hypothetical protein [Dehalococcoidia bacterium]
MNLGKSSTRRLAAGACALALAALPLAAGFAGGAAAEAPSYPLIASMTGAQVGVVDFDGFGTLQQFSINLQGAAPNTTYTVSDCGTNGDGTPGCAAEATPASVTTDALGDAQIVVNVENGPQTEALTLTDTANGADTIVGGPAAAAMLVAPSIIIAPATLP